MDGVIFNNNKIVFAVPCQLTAIAQNHILERSDLDNCEFFCVTNAKMMTVRRIIDEGRVQVSRAELLWRCKNSLHFERNLLLVLVRDGFEIGVENLHVFGVKDFAVVHGDDGFIAADFDEDAAFVKAEADDVRVF